MNKWASAGIVQGMFDLAGGFFLAALPALPILLWLRSNDKARPEPVGLIGKGLFLGIMAIGPAALLEYVLFPLVASFGGLGSRFIEAFLVAALIEEGLKLAFLRRWLWKKLEFDEATDGIVYAVAVSLGFAVVENFIYTWHRPGLLIIRSLTAVPLHALATGLMGYWLGVEKVREKWGDQGGLPRGGWARGLGIAVFVHGSYDYLLLGGGLPALLILPLLILSFLLLRRRFAVARRIDERPGFSVDSLDKERP